MNRKQIYMMVKNQFTTKKAHAEAVAFENMQKALLDPTFNNLHKAERALIFDIAKNNNLGNPVNNLQQELSTIISQKNQRLKELGFTKEDLTPSYECNLCKDTGSINGRLCECFSKKLKELTIYESSCNITCLHSFDDYNECVATDKKQQEQLSKLKNVMTSWIDNKILSEINLICLSGKTGVGKTFLTECSATYALKQGKLVSMISSFAMNNAFLKYHTSKTEEKASALDSLLDPDLLVIDDLGTEPVLNNVTREYLYLLLSERLSNNKKTLITTNLNANEILSRYHERIFSRLYNKRQCKTFELTGNDLRLNK